MISKTCDWCVKWTVRLFMLIYQIVMVCTPDERPKLVMIDGRTGVDFGRRGSVNNTASVVNMHAT